MITDKFHLFRLATFAFSLGALLVAYFPIAQTAHASTTPPEIQYTGINTTLQGDDDSAGPFPVGFNFPFFGTTQTQAYVNINGTLNFGTGSSQYSNTTLSTSRMGTAILGFWDDIITNNDAQSIYYKTIGTAPNRTFITQWTNMYSYANPTLQLGTFQVLLYENSGNIQLQYRDVLGSGQPDGNSATIGLQKDTSTALQYSYNTSVLSSHKAILYTPSGSTYTVTDNAPYDYVYLADAAAPGIATLQSPSDGSTGQSLNPTLTWSAAANATSYTVLLASDSAFSNLITNHSGVTATSYAVTGLSANTHYYWRIEADNASGSVLSGSSSFTTGIPNQAPNTPTALGPTALTTGSFVTASPPPFSFSLNDINTNDQVKYEIQISSDSTFATSLIDYTSGLGSQGNRSFTFGQAAGSGTYTTGLSSTQLTDTTTYYWRVKAIDDSAASSSWTSSPIPSFKIDAIPPTVGTMAQQTTDSSVTITVPTTSDPGSESGLPANPYIFEYSASSDFSSGVTSVSQASPTFTVNLAPGTWYFRVRTTDNAGNFSSYATSRVKVDGPPTLAIQTVDKKVITGNPTISALPTFSGTASPGAKITVTVHSDPVTCTTTANADGKWTCTLASALPAGQHSVSVDAVATDGTPLSMASFPVTVSPQLAATGSPVFPVLTIGILFLILGLGLLRSKSRQQ